MRRLLLSTLAVVTANIAAVFLFWMATSVAVALSGEQPWLQAFLNNIFFVGLFGTVIVSITIFPVSLVVAYLGLLLRWTDRWLHIGGGALIGLAFTIFAFEGIPPSSADNRNAFFFVCIGAICGWIYWRIAIRQTPENIRPITTP